MRSGMCGRAAWAGLACVGLAMVLGTPSAMGQPRTGAAPAGAASGGATFNVDFGGGTVGEYFDVLTRTMGVNIVAEDQVRRLRMPGVGLQEVNSWAAVHVVESLFASSQEGMVRVQDVRAPSPQSLVPAVSRLPYEVPGDTVYVVTYMSRQRPAVVESVHEVFSVADVLRPSNEEAVEPQVRKIFAMIESAMALASGGAEPELAYHDDSQMLVFRGSAEQKRLVEAVLTRYVASWRPQSAEARGLKEEMANLELRARVLSIEAEAWATRLDAARRRRAEVEQMYQAGGASARELAEAQVALAEQESRVQVMRAETEHARARLEELRARIAALTPGETGSVATYDVGDLGERGTRVVRAFQAFVEAAGLDRTRVAVDGGTVVVQAGPALQEALRFVLGSMRERAGGGGTGRQ